jgi:hypothetical protein
MPNTGRATSPNGEFTGLPGAYVTTRWDRLVMQPSGVPILAWVVLFASVAAALGIWQKLPSLIVDYGDVDDALRMVQVREFMASGKWIDTTLPRIGGSEGMLSHWSRLIDLPLALLVGLISLFTPTPTAELTVRILWPVLMLGVLYYTVARSVEIAAGRVSALIVLGLLLTCPSATAQFSVGRIDHHNVQNLAAAATVLLLWLNGAMANAGRTAGLIAGIGIAVGYEALPVILIATAAASIWGMLDRDAAPSVRSYVIWLAGTFAVAFAGTTSPSRWGNIYCDAISLNMVVLLGCGAAGVALALGRGQTWPLLKRWGVVATGGLAGGLLYALAEPRCLLGPMGQTPSALKSVWLIHVPEAESWFRFLSEESHGAIAVAILFAVALTTLAVGLRRQFKPSDAFYLAVLTLTLPLGFWQLKYLAYSSILALVPVAIWLGRLPAIGSLSAPTVRFVAFIVLNQYALMMMTLLLTDLFPTAQSVMLDPAYEAAEVERKRTALSCVRNDNLRSLNVAPHGLVFAPIDLGSHLLADTHHDVLAAPYHRIGPQILDTHALLSVRDMNAAEHGLVQIGAKYVVICPAIKTLITPLDNHPDSFDARLRRGERLPFLEAVVLPTGSPLRMWRVVK